MGIFSSITAINDQTIGTVEIDAKISERHNSKIKITQFPLEDGAITTDHRVIEPKELVIHGAVSNVKTFLEDLTGHAGNSDVTAFEQLVQLQESGEPFSLVSDLVTYNNMLIADIVANKNADLAHSLLFIATLTSVIVVDTQAVKLPKRKIPVPNKNRASSDEKQGTKVPDKVTPEREKTFTLKLLLSTFFG